MFELKVVGLAEADILIEEAWPTRIVSLTSDLGVRHGPHHLHIQVVDIGLAAKHTIYPLPEHLRQVLAFTQDLTDADRLLVHCFAGQSRSTAIAIGICIQHGMSFVEAFAHVAAVRNILLPNVLFIQHIDDHFGLQGALIEHAANHRKLQRTPFLPPHQAGEHMTHLLRMFRL